MALPATIQEIVRLIGHSKAMLLVQHFGGQELNIPKTEGTDTWAALVEVIGLQATQAMARHFSGNEPIYIALCAKALRDERNRRMIARYDVLVREGHSGNGAVSVIVTSDEGGIGRLVDALGSDVGTGISILKT